MKDAERAKLVGVVAFNEAAVPIMERAAEQLRAAVLRADHDAAAKSVTAGLLEMARAAEAAIEVAVVEAMCLAGKAPPVIGCTFAERGDDPDCGRPAVAVSRFRRVHDGLVHTSPRCALHMKETNYAWRFDGATAGIDRWPSAGDPGPML